MFDYIKIEGFKSFKSVELEMPRLAVLIGPNGGGKSNFVDLLMLIAEAGAGQLSNGVLRRGGFRDVVFGFDASKQMRFELRFREAVHAWKLFSEANGRRLDVRFRAAVRSVGVSSAQVTEELVRQESATQPALSADVVSRNKAGAEFLYTEESGRVNKRSMVAAPFELMISQVRDPVSYPAASVVLEEVGGWTFYRDIEVGPDAPVRLPQLIRDETRLFSSGANLASVFYSVQQHHPDIWAEMLEIVNTAYPEFVRLTVPAGGGDGKVLLRWFERPFEKEGMSANLLSDGTLKLLCLIAILKSPDPPPLICIDEPELGLHPDWIKLVAELLQDAACRTQVIVATHSPHIVEKLDADQVIVVDKVDGESKMKRLEKADLEKWLKDFNLSELWLAGHFGGRP